MTLEHACACCSERKLFYKRYKKYENYKKTLLLSSETKPAKYVILVKWYDVLVLGNGIWCYKYCPNLFVNLWLHHQHQVISCTEEKSSFLRPQEHKWGPFCLHGTLIGDGIIHVHVTFSGEPPMKLWHLSICIRIETTDVINYSRHLSR